jgi:hypothetical protein
MKITKLDGRYTANRRWGFAYSVEFPSRDWKKYYALKSQTEKMYGPSVETSRKYLWRDDVETLKTSPWAYKYTRSKDPSFIYFRTEEALNHAVMLYALTITN